MGTDIRTHTVKKYRDVLYNDTLESVKSLKSIERSPSLEYQFKFEPERFMVPTAANTSR